MRRLYYTLLVFVPVLTLLALAGRWFEERPAPSIVGGGADIQWHLIDQPRVLLPLLPVPRAAHPVIRSIHAAGTMDGPIIIQAQTRLPGWLLRLIPVAGFTHERSEWDLCLVRKGRGRPLDSAQIPVPVAPDAVSAWLTGAPMVRVELKGVNPFQFTSWCPGPTEAGELPGPSPGATLFLAAGRSPHLDRFFPGFRPERMEAGPDWMSVMVANGGRTHSVQYGAPGGPPGGNRRLSLRLRYRSEAGDLRGMLKKLLPGRLPPSLIGDVEAECRPDGAGERCEGRLTLTF